MQMRIALVVPGGVDRSGRDRVIPALLLLIERLARRHSLHVFALEQEPEPSVYTLLGATVHNLGRGPANATRRAFWRWHMLLAGLRANGPFDVVHGLWAAPPGAACGAGRAAAGRPGGCQRWGAASWPRCRRSAMAQGCAGAGGFK